MKVKDKVFIVTGATEGLGRAVSESLISKGARVALVSRHPSETIAAGNVSTQHFECDISDKEQVKDMMLAVKKHFGGVDGLVNCAGVWLKKTVLEDVDLESVETVLDTNLKGLIFVTKEVLPELKKASESVLVNVSSKSGTRPMDLQAVYCATKYGVKGFTDTLKLELKGTPVKVLGIYPDGMNTKMFEKAGEGFSSENFMDVSEIAEIITFAIERPGNICIEEMQIEKH